MAHKPIVAGLLACLILVAAGCGTNRQAVSQAKREEDRRIMQVEDLTNQRNALQAELKRVAEQATTMQENLRTAQQQVEQSRIELARARAELETAKAGAALAETQREQLAEMRKQLDELSARVNAAPAAPTEQRIVTPAAEPTTRPGSDQE